MLRNLVSMMVATFAATGAVAETISLACRSGSDQIDVVLDLDDSQAQISYATGLSLTLPIALANERWIVVNDLYSVPNSPDIAFDAWFFERTSGRFWSSVFSEADCGQATDCEEGEYRMFRDEGICARSF